MGHRERIKAAQSKAEALQILLSARSCCSAKAFRRCKKLFKLRFNK